ncbi:uncharacterized protein [Panulirus ornatus]|uniref:uncharacterized protein n=1 Tax=Panulirus ornatus TaxID=150431 RepID=UPI003A8463B5
MDLDDQYISDAMVRYRQTAPPWWVNMNALTVLSIATVAACASAQLLGYPGVYGGYPGTWGAYPGLWNAAAPVTVKAAAPTPLAYNTAPFAPVSPIHSQYHAQDEFGQYSFGHAGGLDSRTETRDAFGVVRGSYNYVDSEGKVQTQHYVADGLGFRVSGTNLPVAPDAPEVPAVPALPGPVPEPVQDTPEVAAAKAVFKSAYDEMAAAAAAAPDSRKKRSVVAIHTPTSYSPFGFPYGLPAPLNYAHPAVVGSPLTYTAGFPTLAAAHGITPYTGYPALSYAAAAPAAARDAELLRVVNNPGHAVSYRVD